MENRVRKRRAGVRGSWWLPHAGFEVRDGIEPTNLVLRMQPTANGLIVPYADDADLAGEIEAYALDAPGARWLVARDIETDSLFPPNGEHQLNDAVASIYEPMKLGGLHRDFASLPLDERSVRSFANRYGFLGFETWHVIAAGAERMAEPILQWYEGIRTMREIVRLWDTFRDPDATLGDFQNLVYDDVDSANWLSSEVGEHETFSPWLLTDVFLPQPHVGRGDGQPRYSAGMVLSCVVSAAIGALALPMVEVRKGGQINLVPCNLLGAMYVLLAQEIMGRSEPPIRCGNCGRWFDARHGSRIYCSDACKMKAYRRSKKGKTEAEG